MICQIILTFVLVLSLKLAGLFYHIGPVCFITPILIPFLVCILNVRDKYIIKNKSNDPFFNGILILISFCTAFIFDWFCAVGKHDELGVAVLTLFVCIGSIHVAYYWYLLLLKNNIYKLGVYCKMCIIITVVLVPVAILFYLRYSYNGHLGEEIEPFIKFVSPF